MSSKLIRRKIGGTKRTSVSTRLFSLLLIIMLVLILDGCTVRIGGLPDQSSDVEVQEVEEQTKRKSEKTTFDVGDIAEFDGISVTLVDVTENSGDEYLQPDDGKVFVICEFEIENNSSKDISLSEIFLFEFAAYIDDYATKPSAYAPLSSDKTLLGGQIAAGKKMNGIIGYDADEGWSNIEIRFTPDFWPEKEITFATQSGK